MKHRWQRESSNRYVCRNPECGLAVVLGPGVSLRDADPTTRDCGPPIRPEFVSSPAMPSLIRQGWNLAASLAAFVADGLHLCTKEQYEIRMTICDACVPPEGFRVGHRCAKCGCNLPIKARGRAFQCPPGKWPPIP